MIASAIFFFFFLLGQPSFHGMVRPIDEDPICLSLEEVTVRAGHKFLVNIDVNNVPIVGHPQGILSLVLRPHSIHPPIKCCYCNINYLSKYRHIILNYVKKLTNILSEGGNGSRQHQSLV
jgi:hypothetical protein